MNSTLRVLALVFVLVAAWAVRMWPSAADPRVAGSIYTTLDDSESSYRLRLIELGLLAERAPRRDQFLARDAVIPWPPLVHSTLAFVARVALPRDASSPELDGYDAARVRDAARHVGPWLGLAATIAIALASAVLVESNARKNAFFAAAALYGVFPLAVGREVAGSLHAHSWLVILLSAQVIALGVALRAKERIDLTLGALVCGVCASLAQIAGAEAWPVSAAILGVFVVLAMRTNRAGKRDHWRGVLLFVASAAALYGIAEPGPAGEFVLPTFDVAAGTWIGASFVTCLAMASTVGLAALGLFRDRREPARAALLAALFPSLVCAFFDRRFFAPLCVIAVCGVIAAVFGTVGSERKRLARVWFGAALLAALSVGASFALSSDTRGAALREALAWLRQRTTSPGAFNHAEAQQNWRVAAAPRLGGSIAYHARRPVAATRFEGHLAGDPERLAAALRAPNLLELSRELALLDCAYLVVSPRMLADPELRLSPDGATALLALDSALDVSPEFERVYVSARRESVLGAADENGAPAVMVYRRVSTHASGGPTLRPVSK